MHSTLNPQHSTRTGFTLVELLVATTLVVLIMLLFAQIFGEAVGTMTRQRALANNDQKARSVTGTIRSDLQRMTFRQPLSGNVRGIVPLSPGDRVDPRQRGFLYFSENDPFDETDDVLHFTVDLYETLRDPVVSGPNQSPFFGRAAPMGSGNRNQPDWDDGEFGNRSGASRAAEIVYFLRAGNLYRRVLLLRDPVSNASPPFSTQPSLGTNGTGGPFAAVFQQPYALTGMSFWHDWDYSGTRVWAADDGNGAPDPEGTDFYRFHFHGRDSLKNDLAATNVPLAIPQNRFGFHFSDTRPREYLLNPAGAPVAYIGRFTHEETSFDEDVNDNGVLDAGEDANGNGQIDRFWPGEELDPAIGANTDNVMTTRNLTLSPLSVVTYGGVPLAGPRAGEDILLTSVEAFDVKLWDPGYVEFDADGGGWTPYNPPDDRNANGVRDNGAWVDLGNAFSLGQYTLTNPPGGNATWRNRNPFYGPIPGIANRVYDTWHPSAGANYNGAGGLEPNEIRPPYRPTQVNPSDPIINVINFWTAGATYVWEDANGNRMLDANEDDGATTLPFDNSNGTLNNHVYFPDRLGFDGLPGVAGVDDDGDGNIDFVSPGVLDTAEIGWPVSDDGPQSVGYRVLSGGVSGVRRPEFPLEPGAIVQDGGVTWQAFDNRAGLERILITIRYRDRASGQPRQVSIIHSFVE